MGTTFHSESDSGGTTEERATEQAVAAVPSPPRQRKPRMLQRPPPPDDGRDLIPRSAAALGRLIPSVYAHCELMHRLQDFSASRALALLLHHLRDHHQLPAFEPSHIQRCVRRSSDLSSVRARPASEPGSPPGVSFVMRESISTPTGGY